jgi:lipopolysaccharide transport system permease protein
MDDSAVRAEIESPVARPAMRDRLRVALFEDQSARLLFTHFRLLLRVVRNDLRARYAGSVLGIGWSIVTPLLILGIYSAVYLYVFQIHTMAGLSGTRYVMFIFSGLVPFLATGEALSLGVTSIVADKALLSNTVFPVDLAPVKPVVTSQVVMATGMTVLLAGVAATGGLHWTVLFLPLLWAAHVVALTGLNWILSLLNVVFRDLQYLIGALLMIMLVASPITYTPQMVPPQLQGLIDALASFPVVASARELRLSAHPPDGEIGYAVIAEIKASGSQDGV